LHNNGQGTFGATSADITQVSAGNYPQSIAPGYFNNDQLLDFAVANYGIHQDGATVVDPGNVKVFINQGNGTYVSSTACAVGFGPAAVVAVDFNGDQTTD